MTQRIIITHRPPRPEEFNEVVIDIKARQIWRFRTPLTKRPDGSVYSIVRTLLIARPGTITMPDLLGVLYDECADGGPLDATGALAGILYRARECASWLGIEIITEGRRAVSLRIAAERTEN